MPNPQTVTALPFTAGAHEYTEPVATRSVLLTANSQDLDPIPVKPYGFLRNLWIGVTCTGGVDDGTDPDPAASGDFPWNIIRSISLHDTNGGNIFGPCSGYSTYIANLLGGYVFQNDPASAPFHSSDLLNPKFFVRVPLEISGRDGFGAWPNQNAAANLSLDVSLNGTNTIWATAAPSTPPTVTLSIYMECWTVPSEVDANGRPQMQTPPLMGTGQFWTSSTRQISVGENDPQVTRTGSYIRALACIFRTTAGVRSDAVAFSSLRFLWDGVQFHKMSQDYAKEYFRNKLASRIGSAQDNTVPVGVYVFPFNHGLSGRSGNETPDLWLPTKQSANLRVEGTAAAAGTVEFLVNDVAPRELDPADKYEVPNQTGQLVNPTA